MIFVEPLGLEDIRDPELLELVELEVREIPWGDVCAGWEGRMGRAGLEEKAARKTGA